MTQKRLGNPAAQKLKLMFFDYCVRVSYEYKTNGTYSDTMIFIAKKDKNQELFRVQRTYTRNCFFPKPNEYGYSVGYSVRKGDKVIADVTLKDTDAEYLTDFPERELYTLLSRKYIRQQKAAQCLGNAFIKALRDEQYSK
jgi:hypothetical protein